MSDEMKMFLEIEGNEEIETPIRENMLFLAFSEDAMKAKGITIAEIEKRFSISEFRAFCLAPTAEELLLRTEVRKFLS